jgi:predicted nucleic acid-binding protein
LILFDADILSYFSKLKRLHLLTDLFAGPLLISPNVQRELHEGVQSGHSELKPALDAIRTGDIELLAMSELAQALLPKVGTPLDKGETDSLAYCLAHDAVFVTNDRRAYRRGQRLSVKCLRLPSLLRLLWTHGDLATAEVRSLISMMESRLGFAVDQKEEIFHDHPLENTD